MVNALKSAKTPTALDSVTITYGLLSLPTAQHKAGLAGLLLQIQSMIDRKLLGEHIPEIIGDVSATSVTIRFTEQSVCGLLNDVYAATVEEARVKAKWPKQTPKREEVVEELDPETKKVSKTKYFVYDVIQPTGHFLRQHLQNDEGGRWHKLWRDMLWQIPRGKPTTRGPYNAAAEGGPCVEGQRAWKDLQAYSKAQKSGAFKTSEISSALLLGAQAINAERVAFLGQVEQTLLLHFWPLTILIFVPQQIDNDGNSEFVGFSLAIPEVSNLLQFCEKYPKLLHQKDAAKRGYRPAGAVIDIPQQSALEFMSHLASLVQDSSGLQLKRLGVVSVEYMHLVKQGNNVKTMASGRIGADANLLDTYWREASPVNSLYRNPLFRSAILLALLKQTSWWTGFENMLQNRPWPFFVRCEKTPRNLSWFATDVAKKFEQSLDDYRSDLRLQAEYPSMNSSESGSSTDRLPVLIHRLVSNYVNRKTEEKSGVKWDSFKDKKVTDDKSGKERTDVPKEYRDAREKVVSDAFLAMRSRRDQDFADYFTASICSVGQFLRSDEKADEFSVVASALLNRRDDVKTLTLLALSANS